MLSCLESTNSDVVAESVASDRKPPAGVALHIADYFFTLCDGASAQVFQVDVTFAPLESTALPGGAVYQVWMVCILLAWMQRACNVQREA